jgi:hypothetical protein
MTTTTRGTVPLGVALAALALAGCSGQDPAPTQAPAATAQTATGDANRYCTLVAELNRIGQRVFADLPENAPPDEESRRQGLLVQQGATQLAELERVAPAEIRADVITFLTNLRARASASQGPDPAAAQAAEQRIRAFEERNCPLEPDTS